MDRVKIGIIGAGRIGRVHAESISKCAYDAELVALSDPYADRKTWEWIQALGLPESAICTENDRLINDGSIDAVLICSPTNTHAELIQKAAEAGKHIFCEKPIHLNIERIHKTLDVVKKAGVKLQVGFNRRFDHNFITLQEAVASGKVGKPHILRITSRDPAPPSLDYIRTSGTLFLDMMIHDFDMARYVIGSEIEDVFAQGACLIDPAIGMAGDVDTAAVSLRFKNGALGLIDNSRRSAYGYDQRAEVFGSLGSVRIENDKPSTIEMSSETGVITDLPYSSFLNRYLDSYAREIEEFIRAIIEDSPVPCGGNDGLQSVVIGLAARKSWKLKRPVNLSEITWRETDEG